MNMIAIVAVLAALSIPTVHGEVAVDSWRGWSARGNRLSTRISLNVGPMLLKVRLRGGSEEEAGLRFKVGDRILAKTADGWRPGTVVHLFYREPEWPQEHKPAPYQIELDSGHFIYAQVDIDDLVRVAQDHMTLEDLALHLSQARAQYLNNTGAPDKAVCRLMLTTKMEHLPIARARCASSGTGHGLFATRDIAEGELITLYPADAALVL